MVDNRDKKPVTDESILEEAPPNINEPQKEEEAEPTVEEAKETPTEPEVAPEPVVEEPKPEEPEPEETEEDKEKRYKAQQTETQIQVAKNKALIDKVDQGTNLPEPTEDELKAFVAQDGVDWDELTTFEQSMAKKNYKAEKSLQLIKEATEISKKIDEWATQVDTFIDSTDGKPEFVELSGHEAEFRSFCMAESHRGVDIQTLLLPAFLKNLPAPKKIRGSLFEKGTGGEKEENLGKITDVDQIRALRESDPREYKRLVKSGKISIDID